MMKIFEHFFQKKKIVIPSDSPLFIRNYADKINNAPSKDKQKIDETRFVVFDTETTGIDSKKDKMLSIGALSVMKNSIAVGESFELFIQQDDIVGNEAVNVHGILKKGKKVKISEKEAVERFVNFCGDSILVGHHVGFDLAMINKHLETNYGIKLQNQVLDTGLLYQRVVFFENYYDYKVASDLSLDALAKSHHIETTDRHRALGDAYITAVLFLKLVNQLKKRKVLTIKELMTSRMY